LVKLIRLSHLTGNYLYEKRAEELIISFTGEVKLSPVSYCFFLVGLESFILPYYDLIIMGGDNREEIKEILKLLRNEYRPDVSVLFIPESRADSDYKELIKLTNFMKEYQRIDNKTTVYICRDYTCQLPVRTAVEVKRVLSKKK
ncbi:MAG: hypothetical protein ACOCQH_00255, partial [Halanaerobiales bacterium]